MNEAARQRFEAIVATVRLLDAAVARSGLDEEERIRWRELVAYAGALGRALERIDEAAARGRHVDHFAALVTRWREALAAWGVLEPAAEATAGFDGFISPGRARARMDSVHAEVTNLDRLVRDHKHQLGRGFVSGWERWRDSWRQFYARYPREWDWWYLGNASAWNETLVFQQRLAQYAEAVQRAGVRGRLPAPAPPPEREGGGDWLGSASTIAVAGAVGAAILGTVYLVSRVA